MNNRVIPIFVLVLSIALFAVYINPHWTGNIADLNAAIAADNDALAAADKYLDREAELLQQMETMDKASLAKLEAFLPNGVDNVGLILSLNGLAARSGLAITSIDVAIPADNAASGNNSLNNLQSTNPTGSVDLTLAATGTYSAFLSFLGGIERSQRLLDVKQVTITGSNTGIYTYQMTIRLYWLR